MTNTTRWMSRLSVAVLTAAFVSACSDQGAVKSEPPPPAAAKAPKAAKPAAPALVSGHGDGASTLPPGHPSIDPGATGAAAAGLPPVPAGAGEGATALTWKVPASWIVETPSSPMRRAQYKVPGNAGDGECVVFYFGPGQGGDPMSNAQRWADQFTLDDGSAARSAMKTSEIEVDGSKVFVVEVAGTYKGGMTDLGPPKPGYRLLGAVAPGPDANWYFKFTGPAATVGEQREFFTSMVRSIKHGAS